jgi:hypothetical protein
MESAVKDGAARPHSVICFVLIPLVRTQPRGPHLIAKEAGKCDPQCT